MSSPWDPDSNWHASPSTWGRRLPVLVLSLVGCGIATDLALFQVGAVAHVWEPLFGNGSEIILKKSAISHLLPVPDAALGALAYLVEAATECVGGRRRWRTRPWAVFATGAVAAALALAAVVLVASQAFWFQAFCTLCLASAACCLVIAALAAPEVWAAVKHYRASLRGPQLAQVRGTDHEPSR